MRTAPHSNQVRQTSLPQAPPVLPWRKSTEMAFNGRMPGITRPGILPITRPDGGLRTSVADLARFFAAMIGGGEFQGKSILQEVTVKAMFQPQFVAGQVLEAVEDGENQQQAITWAYRTSGDGSTVVSHSAGDRGVTSHAYFFPDTGGGAILLVNTSSETESFGLAVRDMLRALLK
ncbi:serine hydrolase [Pseudomonadota bacterium]